MFRRWFPDPIAFRLALLVALGVAAASELRVHPFDTEFRFALGSPVLAFCVLILPRVAPLLTGLTTGIVILFYRSVLTLFISPFPEGTPLMAELLRLHGGGAMYYISMALLIQLLNVRQQVRRPLILLVLMVVVDGAPNLVELFLRTWGLPLSMVGPVLLVAAIRGSIVAGFYFLVTYQQAEVRWLEQQREYRRLLMLVTDLHAEVFFMRKSSREIEAVMAQSHKLYQSLQDQSDTAETALEIARNVHEVKKDYHRILSGLDRLIRRNDLPGAMSFSVLAEMVCDVNRSHAHQLGKQVSMDVRIDPDLKSDQYMHWASILNNLISNAIEASGPVGRVLLEIHREGDELIATVIDQGPGIPDTDWDLIFQPGFSTKVNPETGSFSTGLGLSHVQNLTTNMGGRVFVARSGSEGTAFTVRCPVGA